MALNPIVFTEKVVRSFLRYQLTAYPFADERLHGQMRRLLSLDETRQSPLVKGPYISLSRPFREGASVEELISEGIFHPHMRQRIPSEISHVYGHQEDAIRSIKAGRTTLVSTGTGSGKTECFLYPVISGCLELRDDDTPSGIGAVIVYPMNALAEDQLGRLRGLLAGTGISFGMYVGKTPETESEVTGLRLPAGSSRADYLAAVAQGTHGESVHPPEEVCSREVMRTPGRQPRILLTNVKQLELLLTRQHDVSLFANARLDFLVFDEAHTFSGAQGAETACLIRRLRAFCGRDPRETVCIATSATIVDRENPDAAKQFASRFFGVSEAEVVTVGEAYEGHVWADDRAVPPLPVGDPAVVLNECVKAVEADDDGHQVRQCFQKLAGRALAAGEVHEALGGALLKNELLFALADTLSQPRPLADVPAQLETRLGRNVTEAEILAWLTLAAAARVDGRPLLRPVVHVFARGISGGVVTFEDGRDEPRLWLAAEDEIASHEGKAGHSHLKVTTCTTCGQHYFVTFLKDFEHIAARPGGGQAVDDASFWEPLEEAKGGKRVILLDRLIGSDDDEELEEHERLGTLHLCRQCGAAHPEPGTRCLHCGRMGNLVQLRSVRQKKDNPGYLTSCLSCGANGRAMFSIYREPARQVRATNVADVHVLAQDMVHHSERPRLLVFCDNRQDAAFQAGWMKDHARRFRLRALMADGLRGSVSIGDVVRHVDDLLENDESLSRALVPEVWQVQRREGGQGRHEIERRKFLRIQVLREVTLSARQAIGLEPWGRMKVEYQGLDSSLQWIQTKAHALGMPADDLRDGIGGVLDYLRRRRALHDPEHGIFTQYWQDGNLEIQQGYLPQFGSPVGTKLRRADGEKQQLVLQLLSLRGETPVRQIVKKWGVAPDDAEAFVEDLFGFLKDEGLLRPVRLKGAKGKFLPGISGLYQVDADRLRLNPNHGFWRCRNCRRRTVRRTPLDKCLAWRCSGELEFVKEDPDNYDLQLLDQGYSMLRPEEHTAMVPHDERERLENLFKGESDAVNCFVCTPTLELGVDIGQLDAVLMRNVPPLPANYWQRAGRAGRRHRMAVDVTYCRPTSHDRAYFAEPLKLLDGKVDPPAFNLRNDQMVAKHVRAMVITRLHQYTRDAGRAETQRQRIDDILRRCLPREVSSYLFDETGNLRGVPFDLSGLEVVISGNADDLTSTVQGAFHQGWPAQDASVVTTEELRGHVTGFCEGLRDVIRRLERRLKWAMGQIDRLNQIRGRQGALEPEDEALFNRCNTVVKRLKGRERRRRREAEGYDDTNTFGVLAAEGFLPGYGLESGSILGTAEVPYWRTGAMSFTMPRPPSVALREYVPGNLIYANGNKFVARRFHREVDEARIEMPCFEVSTDRQAVKETPATAAAGGLSSAKLPAISVCDVDLIHQSHISDDEELRFQMPVSVFGYERDQHNGGKQYQWGERAVQHRRGVRMRLVNVGSTSAIQRGPSFGYPVCTVCGYSVSPLSSDKQRQHFDEDHEKRCGRKPVRVGFFADVIADGLSLPACADAKTAYSVLEAIRMGAAEVLDMHMDDLQLLVIGHVDRAEVDGLLWDPMPGGSGLLDQVCERFDEIVSAALRVVQECPAACETSCIDCLQTFRNSFYHRHLERKLAAELLTAWGPRLAEGHDIPAKVPTREQEGAARPVNEAERRLRHLLLAAGFEEGTRGEQLRLDPAIGTTTPDVIYRSDAYEGDEGVAVYLDGLSNHLHGNPLTAEKDRTIRAWLRNNDWDVIEIAVSDLADAGAMQAHFKKLGRYLRADDVRERVSRDTGWFEQPESAPLRFVPRVVRPSAADCYRTAVPLSSLKAAAGAFSETQLAAELESGDWTAIETGHRLRKGMFIAQVVGKSMEPAIPDGSYCLFSSPVEGSRQGKTVLVRLEDRIDPEFGGGYTVKRYSSEKASSEDGTWRHLRVTLKPENPDYEPIVLTADQEGSVAVVAELIEVLG